MSPFLAKTAIRLKTIETNNLGFPLYVQAARRALHFAMRRFGVKRRRCIHDRTFANFLPQANKRRRSK